MSHDTVQLTFFSAYSFLSDFLKTLYTSEKAPVPILLKIVKSDIEVFAAIFNFELFQPVLKS